MVEQQLMIHLIDVVVFVVLTGGFVLAAGMPANWLCGCRESQQVSSQIVGGREKPFA